MYFQGNTAAIKKVVRSIIKRIPESEDDEIALAPKKTRKNKAGRQTRRFASSVEEKGIES